MSNFNISQNKFQCNVNCLKETQAKFQRNLILFLVRVSFEYYIVIFTHLVMPDFAINLFETTFANKFRSTIMSVFEYIIGEPIAQFPESRLPTLKHVLCFYAQYWGSRGSDSQKSKLVAQELIQLYRRENILVLSEKTIKDKISINVAELKTILKFKHKSKTNANLQKETNFRSKLDEIFEIRQMNEHENESTDEIEYMETEYSDGKSTFALQSRNVYIFFFKYYSIHFVNYFEIHDKNLLFLKLYAMETRAILMW